MVFADAWLRIFDDVEFRMERRRPVKDVGACLASGCRCARSRRVAGVGRYRVLLFTDEASVHEEAQETVGDTGDVVLDVVAVG